MALHRMTGGLDVADVPQIARFVDDTRPGASLPHAQITQAVQRCYPVTWTATTPSSGALAALAAFYATPFETPSAYHAWSYRTPDPEHSFEVWNARLARIEPPARELVERIRATDVELFTRLMVYRCHGDDRCGVSPTELGALMKSHVGPERAKRWLEGTESPIAVGARPGETYFNVLLLGETLFSAADLPALEALWTSKKLGHSYLHAMLGVLLSRMKPADARGYLRQLLAHGSSELMHDGVVIGLREAARRDPRGTESELASWFFVRNEHDDDQRAEIAILQGLVEADERAAPVLGRLLRRPVVLTTASAAAALHRAGSRFGCPDLGDVHALGATAGKGQSEVDYADAARRAEAARGLLATKMRSCAEQLRSRR